jgi:sugar phosphate isomerase/epimerase
MYYRMRAVYTLCTHKQCAMHTLWFILLQFQCISCEHFLTIHTVACTYAVYTLHYTHAQAARKWGEWKRVLELMSQMEQQHGLTPCSGCWSCAIQAVGADRQVQLQLLEVVTRHKQLSLYFARARCARFARSLYSRLAALAGLQALLA